MAQNWIRFSGRGPGSPDSSEVESLRRQAEIYKEDFFRERKAREEAEQQTKVLEADLAALKAEQASTEQQRQTEWHDSDDEKRNLFRKNFEVEEERRLLRQQVEILQARLRQMERDRRTMASCMHPAGKTVTQPWVCSMCTFQNAMGARKCETCMQPAPEQKMPLPPLRDRVVCD